MDLDPDILIPLFTVALLWIIILCVDVWIRDLNYIRTSSYYDLEAWRY